MKKIINLASHRSPKKLNHFLAYLVGQREGIDLKALLRRLDWNDNRFEKHLQQLKMRWEYPLKMGYLKQKGYRFYLSDPDGMEISNQIIVEMILWWDSLNNSSFA